MVGCGKDDSLLLPRIQEDVVYFGVFVVLSYASILAHIQTIVEFSFCVVSSSVNLRLRGTEAPLNP